jgi:MraZ protein
MFRGCNPTRMDEKSRLKIPSSFRRVLEDRYPGNRFYVTSTNGESAQLYPLVVWEEIEAKLAQVPNELPSKQRFLSVTSYFGSEQEADSQGRLLIPAPLRLKAELHGDVMVLGKMNFLEVWNAERQRLSLEQNPYTEADALILGEFGL